MRRVVRSLGWVIAAGVAVAVFVAAGAWSAAPLRWGDLGGWMTDTDPADAVVEVARWAGIAIAGYVGAVATLVFIGDLAGWLRWLPVARLFRRLGAATAVPVLRRRLVHVTTATAITVSTLSVTATGAGVGAAPVPVEQTVDVPMVALPAGLSPTAFAGFNLRAAPTTTTDEVVDEVVVVVEAGDTLWALVYAHYGHADATLVDEVARVNGLVDPNLIHPGQTLRFPTGINNIDDDPAVDEVVVERGDTVWALVEARYGHADATLVGEVARVNGLVDPNLIHPGQVLRLPTDITQPASAETEGVASWSAHRTGERELLRDLLEDHYGSVDEHLLWEIADLNGIEDPTDLAAGVDLLLPPHPTDPSPQPTTTTVVEGVAAPPGEPATPNDTDTTVEEPAAATTTTIPTVDDADTTVDEPAVAATTTGPGVADTDTIVDEPAAASTVPVVDDGVGSEQRDDTAALPTGGVQGSTGGVPAVPWLAGGAGLAAAFGAMLERFRRSRRDEPSVFDLTLEAADTGGVRWWRCPGERRNGHRCRHRVSVRPRWDRELDRWVGRRCARCERDWLHVPPARLAEIAGDPYLSGQAVAALASSTDDTVVAAVAGRGALLDDDTRAVLQAHRSSEVRAAAAFTGTAVLVPARAMYRSTPTPPMLRLAKTAAALVAVAVIAGLLMWATGDTGASDSERDPAAGPRPAVCAADTSDDRLPAGVVCVGGGW